MNQLKTMICCLLAGISASLSAQQTTTVVKDFRLAGPFAITTPYQTGNVDAKGRSFNDMTLLKGFNASESVKEELWSGDVLPSLADSKAVGQLSFGINNESYLDGRLEVKGPKTYQIYIDGREAGPTLKLSPAHQHVVKITYLADAGAADSIHVSIKADKSVPTTATGKHLFSLMDVLHGKRVTSASLSPNGQYLLVNFTTTDGNRSTSSTELRETATNRRIAAISGGAQWMPRTNALQVRDGNTLYKVNPATQQRTVFMENAPQGYYTLSPTEDYLIIRNRDEGTKEDPEVFEILEPEDRQPGWRDRSTLSKVDVQTGVTTPLTFGSHAAYLTDISNDGTKLLLNVRRSRLTKRPTDVTDVLIMDANTLQVDTIMRGAEFLGAMSFSPDGKELLIQASAEAFNGIGNHVKPGQIPSMYQYILYRYDIATGKVTPLTDKITQSIESYDWSRHDGQIYFSANHRDLVYLYSLDPKTGKITDLGSQEDVVSSYSLAADAPVMAYVGQGAQHSNRLHLLNLNPKKRTHTLLEDSNVELLKDVELGDFAEWNYVNQRGDTIYGRYYLPPHFDATKKYPMIVNYYGGCTPTERVFESRYPHNAYASQGYVVYVVQPSGAAGFGQEFAARHVNSWGLMTADDIIEGTKKFCAEHSFVDASKIGCIGASYGGFMTQYLQTVTDIFAAAISHAGISDITSYWGEGYWGYSYSEVASAGKYPWNARDMYTQQSPLFNADKIHTPLLFLHGTADTNVPIGESIQMFTALKLLGRETAFVAVKDQNHHILDYQKRLKWQETIFAWFSKYLKNDASWWEALYPEKDL